MFDLERSIKHWLKNLRKQQAFDEGAIREMELHLRDHIEDLVSEGLTEQEAFKKAVDAFGEISPIADEDYTNIQRKTTIRSLLFRTMLNNYFKTTFRGMMKNPMSSFINLFGLAVAIGACMVTYAFIDYDYSIDRFHEHKHDLYLTTYTVDREGSLIQYGTTPAPLGAMLREDFPGIEKVCRIQSGSAVIRYEDKVFSERINYVDPEYLEVFTFPLKWGTSNSIRENNNIILSEEMSIKYFGDENPVGQTVKVLYGTERFKIFKVSGVAKEFPKARIIDFDFLVNIENYKLGKPDFNFFDWEKEIDATLIQVKNPQDLASIKQNMTKYQKIQNGIDTDWPVQSFDFVSLYDLHMASGKIRNDISYDATEEGRISLPIIAGFLLILACFNYINIAIVSGARRLKEIGLRKVIGANKRLIITQFFAENFLLTALAAVIGFILAATLFLPWFASFAPVTDEFNLLDPTMWSFLLFTLLLTAILSGLYPAFYISKFKAVEIFRGSLKFGKKNVLTKVFLTLQLAFTCVGIAFAVMLAENSDYQKQRSWGYDREQILFAYTPDYATYSQFEKKLLENSKVEAVVGSKHHFTKTQASITISSRAVQYEVKELSVGKDYLQSLGLPLKEGRFILEEGRTDHKKIMVNEQFVKSLALTNAVGEKIRMNDHSYEIVGVVGDAHFFNFYYKIDPTIFTIAEKEDYRYISVKVNKNDTREVYDDFQAYSKELFPDMPFLGGFQEDLWYGFYIQVDIQEQFSKVIAILFILLSSLGLYGLIQLNLAGRVREFSVRKTLGATKKHITFKIFQQYAGIFIISIIIGAPLGYLMNTALLDMMYPGPRPFGYFGAVLSAIILIFILTIVVFTQVNRVIRANPVEGLKAE